MMRHFRSLIGLVVVLLAVSLRLEAQGGPNPRPHVHGPQCYRTEPGAQRVVEERVWVPGREARVWLPPRYRTERDASGNPIQVLERRGYYETVKEPGRFEVVKTYVPGPPRRVKICGG